MNVEDLKEVKLALDSLAIYRQLLVDPVVSRFYKLIAYVNGENVESGEFISLYNDFFFNLFNSGQDSFPAYLIERILTDVNPYTRKSQSGEIDGPLSVAVLNDLGYLQKIAETDSAKIKEYAGNCCYNDIVIAEKISQLPQWGTHYNNPVLSARPWADCLDQLTEFYRKNGTGIFARYRAFVWERTGDTGALQGIDSPDPITLTGLIGYEAEREAVIENTRQFLKGYPANNVLLYGDRGTGKSSTVKALLNEYHSEGLRMIEVPKRLLVDFPEIIRSIKNQNLKFIIFVDDLSFKDSEESYTALKAVLEGGLESKPKNVLIYATSNRRHLIKETFSDRAGVGSGNLEDEVRAADTMQEKFSLADRFGITVVFTSPDKKVFLDIVNGLVAQRGIEIDWEQLQKEALLWELKYNARSPRTARQFVDWLEGKLNL